ncbi:UNVERIFIED_CONTAM: hypothetical protein GTU68_029459 [Idotea baltica]|nr:hypothetical protein [Idotea baltica]
MAIAVGERAAAVRGGGGATAAEAHGGAPRLQVPPPEAQTAPAEEGRRGRGGRPSLSLSIPPHQHCHNNVVLDHQEGERSSLGRVPPSQPHRPPLLPLHAPLNPGLLPPLPSPPPPYTRLLPHLFPRTHLAPAHPLRLWHHLPHCRPAHPARNLAPRPGPRPQPRPRPPRPPTATRPPPPPAPPGASKPLSGRPPTGPAAPTGSEPPPLPR